MSKRPYDQIKFDIKPQKATSPSYNAAAAAAAAAGALSGANGGGLNGEQQQQLVQQQQQQTASGKRLRTEYVSPLYHLLNLDEINSRDVRDTSLTFRYAIKPWLQLKLAPLGIMLAIERSDSKKVVFRCRNRSYEGMIDSALGLKHDSGNGARGAEGAGEDVNNTEDENDEAAKAKAADKSMAGEADKSSVVSEDDKSGRRKYHGCCFKIRANYSKKSNKWNISIVNDKHNHPLVANKSFYNNDSPIDLSHARLPLSSDAANNALLASSLTQGLAPPASSSMESAAAAAAAAAAAEAVASPGLFMVPNYSLIAAHLYSEQNNTNIGANGTSSDTAKAHAQAHDSLSRLIHEGTKSINDPDKGNAMFDKKLTIKDKSDQLSRLINDIVLDRLIKKNIANVANPQRALSDDEKSYILSQVISEVANVLQKHNISV